MKIKLLNGQEINLEGVTNVLILAFDNKFSGLIYSFFRARQNIFLMILSKMCNKNFENRLINKYFISENIFDRDDFSIVKKHGREVTIFPENLKNLNMLSKMLEINMNLTKDLPEIKTFESSQQFCWNSKFMIKDYLPCPCKIPIGINFYL